jgi:hypothetical protein
LRVQRLLNEAEERGVSEDGAQATSDPYDPIANSVWGIGRIVFELMTHISGTDFGQALKINDSEDPDKDFEDYEAERPFSSSIEIWHKMLEQCIHADLVGSFPYSDHLRELVADMLNPDQTKRPKIEEIEARAQDGLSIALATLNSEYEVMHGRKRQLTKAQIAKKKVLYYTQEQWANIPNGVIGWKEKQDKELDWLRAWARSLFNFMDPEGPMIKQPNFMKANDEPWDRFAGMARSMAVLRTDGKVVPLQEVRLVRFDNPQELEKAVKKSNEVTREGTSTKRAPKNDAADEPPKKKRVRGRVSLLTSTRR